MAKGYGGVKEGPAGGQKNPAGSESLSGAVKELNCQHPIKYDDRGPHRDKNYHVRHEGMAGLHSKGSHGR
jgi:hypothetical protein